MVLEGRGEAFEQLVERYRQPLYACVFAVLRHPKDAEDALQEAFVRIYLSLPQYREQGLKTWLTRIAVNCAIDHKRKLQRRAEQLHTGGSMEEGAAAALWQEPIEAPIMQAEERRRVREMIDSLPEAHRHIVRLYYLEERSYKEIAALEQVELKTVESRLYRAKLWMRKHWKEEEWQ